MPSGRSPSSWWTTTEEGLRAAEADPPALLVLDLIMPERDGFAFISRFRPTLAGRDVPIAVWTVMPLSPEERRSLQASAGAVVAKSGRSGAALMEELGRWLGASERRQLGHG